MSVNSNPHTKNEPIVDPSELPSALNVTFSNSTFFKTHGTTLPSPDEVVKRGLASGLKVSNTFRPAPVRFPELGLLVKWGTDVTIGEGQCLWFMHNHVRNRIPVPEIYGWRCDGETTYLYMELIDADTLESRWTNLTESDRKHVCGHLRDILQSIRQLKRVHSSHVISQIGGQGIRDIMFQDGGCYPAGPFTNLAAFHDAFAQLASRVTKPQTDLRKNVEELSGLADDVDIVFTHADLDQSNILVSKPGDGPVRIVALIDWHQSGWYPEPWELLKAQSVAYPESGWQHYVPLPPAEKGYTYSWTFVDMALI